MKKELNHISFVNAKQAKFCRRLGLDVNGDTVSVAVAKLYDMLDKDFFSNSNLGIPTEKQIQLASQFGYNISHCTKREGEAIISDIMNELNMEAIEIQKLEPGIEVTNKWDQFKRVWIISSIQEDGLVFFKGGNGKKAWARNLIKK